MTSATRKTAGTRARKVVQKRATKAAEKPATSTTLGSFDAVSVDTQSARGRAASVCPSRSSQRRRGPHIEWQSAGRAGTRARQAQRGEVNSVWQTIGEGTATGGGAYWSDEDGVWLGSGGPLWGATPETARALADALRQLANLPAVAARNARTAPLTDWWAGLGTSLGRLQKAGLCDVPLADEREVHQVVPVHVH